MKEKLKDLVLKLWIFTSLGLVVGLVAFILIYIFKNGYRVISLDFLRGVPEGLPLGKEGGIYPAIMGSLALMGLSLLFSSILALGTGIYLNFYCESGRVKALVQLIVQCIAGVPSIVLGLFGYTLFVLKLGLGRSLLSAGLTLAVMIFPFIEVRVEKILAELDPGMINSSYALGLPKYYTILRLVLPSCRQDIISAITLAGALSIGASAPIMSTGAVLFAEAPKSLSNPVMALPLHLYILIGEGVALDMAYGTALVLVGLLLLINILALLVGRMEEEN